MAIKTIILPNGERVDVPPLKLAFHSCEDAIHVFLGDELVDIISLKTKKKTKSKKKKERK